MAEPIEEFLAALRDADTALSTARGLLDGARVHDEAFGRLFEAHAVRDAYHDRLPEIVRDVDESRAVVDHFITGIEGGHPIASVPSQQSAPTS